MKARNDIISKCGVYEQVKVTEAFPHNKKVCLPNVTMRSFCCLIL